MLSKRAESRAKARNEDINDKPHEEVDSRNDEYGVFNFSGIAVNRLRVYDEKIP